MPSFANLPFRQKLTAAIVFTSTLVLLLACAALMAFDYMSFSRNLEQNVATLARITAGNSTAAIAFTDEPGAAQTLEALRAEPQIVSAVLYDRGGRVFAHYPATSARPAALAPDESPGVRLVGGLIVCLQEVAEGDRHLGMLRIEASRAAMYDRLRIYGIGALVVGAISVAVAWILATALQRRIARPVLELVRTARAVEAEEDYSLRAARYDSDDLGELTESFNDMLGKIQSGVAASRKAAEEIGQLNAGLEQRVRERTAQLEEANRELESFSYSVSHDLRAPLRHIQGYAGMLVRATNGSLPDKAARYLQIITDASGEMGQLIDDLLAFSRMGRADLREDAVDLGNLVDEVRQTLEMSTRNRDVRWEIAPMPRVLGDRAMLKLVFANLVGNAVKFTRTREQAHIHVGCAGDENGRAIIFVRDNGVGFDMAYYEKLFGVFQRLHRAEDFEGTGIGLASVRRIITRHGGRVWAESVLNQHAAFFFTLKPDNDGNQKF